MGKPILCIAEKPSVAGDIARLLGATGRKDGYYEGGGYRVSWALGHLCTLKDPQDYTPDWKKWSMATLPIVPDKYEIKESSLPAARKQLKILKSLLKDCSKVVNCGDAGQEGELIQRWILQYCGYKGLVERLWISSLTDEALRAGFSALRPSADYDNLYLAGMCRACGDWLLGMNASRLYTLRYGGYGSTLSVGRVQTPTLAMIVARDREIRDFVPEDYFLLCTVYRGTRFWLDAETKKFSEIGKAETIAAEAARHSFVIDSFETKKESETPPQLFDLTALQVECNKVFGFSADRTLKIAQSLYEKKITTYPRTDSRYLTMDMYAKCSGILSKLEGRYCGCPSEVRDIFFGSSPLIKRPKVFNDAKVSDHHAIIPTGQLGALDSDEAKVFGLIANRFVMQFLPDAVYGRAICRGHAGDIAFKANGRILEIPGWRSLMASEQVVAESGETVEDDKDQNLPRFCVGEDGRHEPAVVKKTTRAPKPYTEGTLLKAMETCGKMVADEDLADALKANGIGRPSTRAAIIETLLRRGYVVKSRNTLSATDAGRRLVDVIKSPALVSPELTGSWERHLRDMEKGGYSASQFMKEIRRLVEELISSAKDDTAAFKIEAQAQGKSSKGVWGKGGKSRPSRGKYKK